MIPERPIQDQIKEEVWQLTRKADEMFMPTRPRVIAVGERKDVADACVVAGLTTYNGYRAAYVETHGRIGGELDEAFFVVPLHTAQLILEFGTSTHVGSQRIVTVNDGNPTHYFLLKTQRGIVVQPYRESDGVPFPTVLREEEIRTIAALFSEDFSHSPQIPEN